MNPRDCLAAVRQHMTNRKIAAELGVHEVTVARWVSGTREITDWRHADALRALAEKARAAETAG